MSNSEYRIEHDSMGEVAVPARAQWGAQTQRALQNFQFSELRFPSAFIRSVALIKWAAAQANVELSGLDVRIGGAIETVAASERSVGGKTKWPMRGTIRCKCFC